MRYCLFLSFFFFLSFSGIRAQSDQDYFCESFFQLLVERDYKTIKSEIFYNQTSSAIPKMTEQERYRIKMITYRVVLKSLEELDKYNVEISECTFQKSYTVDYNKEQGVYLMLISFRDKRGDNHLLELSIVNTGDGLKLINRVRVDNFANQTEEYINSHDIKYVLRQDKQEVLSYWGSDHTREFDDSTRTKRKGWEIMTYYNDSIKIFTRHVHPRKGTSYTTYWEDGSVRDSSFYVKFEEVFRKAYYSNGNPDFKRYSIRDTIYVEYYYSNGQLKKSSKSVDNKLEGESISYYYDGGVLNKEHFKKGEMFGVSAYYNVLGKVTSEYKYGMKSISDISDLKYFLSFKDIISKFKHKYDEHAYVIYRKPDGWYVNKQNKDYKVWDLATQRSVNVDDFKRKVNHGYPYQEVYYDYFSFFKPRTFFSFYDEWEKDTRRIFGTDNLPDSLKVSLYLAERSLIQSAIESKNTSEVKLLMQSFKKVYTDLLINVPKKYVDKDRLNLENYLLVVHAKEKGMNFFANELLKKISLSDGKREALIKVLSSCPSEGVVVTESPYFYLIQDVYNIKPKLNIIATGSLSEKDWYRSFVMKRLNVKPIIQSSTYDSLYYVDLLFDSRESLVITVEDLISRVSQSDLVKHQLTLNGVIKSLILKDKKGKAYLLNYSKKRIFASDVFLLDLLQSYLLLNDVDHIYVNWDFLLSSSFSENLFLIDKLTSGNTTTQEDFTQAVHNALTIEKERELSLDKQYLYQYAFIRLLTELSIKKKYNSFEKVLVKYSTLLKEYPLQELSKSLPQVISTAYKQKKDNEGNELLFKTIEKLKEIEGTNMYYVEQIREQLVTVLKVHNKNDLLKKYFGVDLESSNLSEERVAEDTAAEYVEDVVEDIIIEIEQGNDE